ncbi:MAG: pyridoxamine kinase [Candidatus Cloacimonetes bacterium]|nr:pyridoxamine kinase [Candidatus Cloacimonadota bacterium]
MDKRLLAMHDLSGVGHTSLMAIIPIMYHYGIQVCPFPTAILSANTCYPNYVMQDTTPFMRDTLTHWKSLGIKYDLIYSGFLGSPAQVDILIDAVSSLLTPDGMVVVDPVLADDGELYSCYDESMVTAMKKAIAFADIITPNYTEACFLTATALQAIPSLAEIETICLSLCKMGAKQVIITSIPQQDKTHTLVAYYQEQSLQTYSCHYVPYFYSGTGDVFTSLIIAKVLCNIPITEAIPQVIDFIHAAILETLSCKRDGREGICLDKTLAQLANGLPISELAVTAELSSEHSPNAMANRSLPSQLPPSLPSQLPPPLPSQLPSQFPPPLPSPLPSQLSPQADTKPR